MRAVRFLPKAEGDASDYLVTGGDDQCLKIWALNSDGRSASCIQTEHEHSAAINCIVAAQTPADGGSRRIFVTGASDATIRIWSFGADHRAALLQTITTPNKSYPLAAAISPLGEDGNAFVLAVAGTSSLIHIYAASLGESGAVEFKLQATLPGHENWIRSLDFVLEKTERGSDLILASGCQDKYVRLWRVHQGTALSAMKLDDLSTLGGLAPGNKLHKMKVGGVDYCVLFEALLLGHEDWVYSARWSRNATGKLQLLSASADNSLAVWECDADSGIWITTARMGEVSKDKGATTATGSIGGFWTSAWSPSGTTVVTLGRTGAWRRWDFDEAQDQWLPHIAISGHTRAVTGISWSRDGAYLLSTSADQTSRLHAQWKARGTWHEMSRPQIHGYDLNCIDSLGDASFVSGADEKLMRVFTEPKAVAKMLARLTGIGAEDQARLESRPDAANMPVLGLSNKAIDAIDDDAELDAGAEQQGPPGADDREALDPASMVRKSALDIDHPPLEEGLSRHTLWPEIEKLYGHGYEISCLAASHDGRLVASACKASSLNHAVLRIFETERWTEIRPPLAAHSLTATRIRFSPDDRYILSVGRDRQWAVFERAAAGDGEGYTLAQSNPKGHTRMILDAAWAPFGARAVFATAGRDKQVKIWIQKGAASTFELAAAIPDDHAVTALDFLPAPSEDGHLVLAVGTEGGKLTVLRLKVDGDQVVVASTLQVAPELCLSKPVLQLAWRPLPRKSETSADTVDTVGRELAIAGEDGTLRIYSFPLE